MEPQAIFRWKSIFRTDEQILFIDGEKILFIDYVIFLDVCAISIFRSHVYLQMHVDYYYPFIIFGQ